MVVDKPTNFWKQRCGRFSVIAAALNFCTALFNGKTALQSSLKNLAEVKKLEIAQAILRKGSK